MDFTHTVAHHQQLLEAADRVARAAHLWIRHGFPGAHTELVAGVICGLCDALELDDSHALLAGYAYALIDDQTVDALVMADAMLRHSSASRSHENFRTGQFQTGRQAARDLIVLLEPGRILVPQMPLSACDSRN